MWGVGNRVPEPFDGYHYAGECVWVYEIEGFWSTCKMSWMIMRRSGDHHLHYCHCCCTHSVHCVIRVCQQASSGEAQFSSEPFFDRPREESVSRVVCPILVENSSFYVFLNCWHPNETPHIQEIRFLSTATFVLHDLTSRGHSPAYRCPFEYRWLFMMRT